MKGLITSDVDGTLMPEGSMALPGELFPEIRRLTDEGWLFCPASGRQYGNLLRLFAPVADRLAFLSENGAVVHGPGGELLGKTVIPRHQAIELCRDIQALEGCEVNISGENRNYLVPKTDVLVRRLRDMMHNNLTVLSDFEELPEDAVKISAYVPAGTDTFPRALIEKWACLNPAVAGKIWQDFTLSNKGEGLKILCDALDFPIGEVIAFGDNYNDIPILSLAGHPYLMSTAAPPLLARFPNHCDSVIETLRTL